MAGFVGVLDRTGAEVEQQLVSDLVTTVAERGPDGTRLHLDGSFGIGFAAFATTPQDAAHPQPAIDHDAGVCAFLDGRLDDREGLASALGRSADTTLGHADAQLALAAYLSLGPDWASSLIGDFALIIWDRRRRRLLCVRDASGIKPLYYALGPNYFVFGSNTRSVLLHPAVPRHPNLGMLGEYLACACRHQEDTLYTAVRRLPPGHVISVDQRQAAVTRYWDLDPHRRIRYRDARDYRHHFRELMRRAVADRLRCDGPLGVSLSGGMDSSAVAGVAQQLLDETGSGARLRAYSAIFPGEACDETPFIDAVVARGGLVSRRFAWRPADASSWVR